MANEYTLTFAVLLGLFSTLHCVGMCGGIVCALSFSLPERMRAAPALNAAYVAAYNLGRISTYAVLGMLVGFTGELLGGNIDPMLWRTAAAWLAGITLILIGLYLSGWVHQVRYVDHLGAGLWRRIEPFARRMLPVKNLPMAFMAGMLWGFLPCGLVYYALLLTLPLASPVQSGLFMVAFGFGTLPSLMATGLFAGLLVRLTRNERIRQIAGAMIILMGIAGLIAVQSGWVHKFMPASTLHEHH